MNTDTVSVFFRAAPPVHPAAVERRQELWPRFRPVPCHARVRISVCL